MSGSAPALLPALVAGASAALALAELARLAAGRLPGAARRLAALARLAARAGSEDRDPGTAERRRLLAAGAGAAFAVGALVAGPAAGLVLGAAAPSAVARALAARRERYRGAVERGAPALAVALADALGAGHSLRGALVEAAPGVPGAAGAELRRVAAELAAGAGTEDALQGLRVRARTHSVDVLVAACLLQRRAGGDLAALLRDCARSFDDEARLRGELRAATAQARFTGVLVVLLPLGGALLAELASPGWLAGLWSSFLTAWLVGLAVVLQAVAAVLIRRFGRVAP